MSFTSVFSWFRKMFLRTLALVLMFLVRLRFSSRLSLLQIIRNRYGDTVVELVRKFEKVEFKHPKAAFRLNFLQTCRKVNVIPIILGFRIANKSLQRSLVHKKCLNHLLLAEINNKKKNLKVLVNELSLVKSNLLHILNFLDFNHVCNIIISNNEKSLLRDTHREKAPSNETPALRESTTMGVWAVGTLNRLFIKDS